MDSIPKDDDKVNALLSAYMHLKRVLTEAVVPYSTRVRNAASLLCSTRHALVVNDADVKSRWRVGLGPEFS